MQKHLQSFEVTIRDRSISVRGDLDLATTHLLVDAITGVALDPDHLTVVVDLAMLAFLDSTGIKGLMKAHQSLAAEGKELVLQDVPERALRTLTVSGVLEQLNVASVV